MRKILPTAGYSKAEFCEISQANIGKHNRVQKPLAQVFVTIGLVHAAADSAAKQFQFNPVYVVFDLLSRVR